MVGSKDFNDESIDGQVNVALTPQQPGSSIKPFTYLTAFRKGWTPASVIWDVPIGYEIPGFGVYEPDNYDGKFRGPVTVREALSNSLNIPAVQTLDFVGVPELLQTLNDVGITSLGDRSNPYNLGLSLTLGAGDVYLLEWTDAYATLANGGVYHPTYAIEKIEKNGQVIQQYEVPEGKQVFDGNQVYLLTSILSDKVARVPSFGTESPLSPPYPAAAKTGTTNDFRDNWTMGFTSEIAVGVWVGNTDNSQMLNVTGVTGAGPIWRGVMDASQQWYPAQEFRRPAAIFEQTVCNDDGALPSAYCQEHSQVHPEVFGPDNQPTPADKGLYRQLRVDQFSGLIANEFCDKFAQDKFFVVLPNPSQLIDLREFEKNWLLTSPEGQAWGTQRGIPLDRFEQAPTEPCKQDTPQPIIEITSPVAGQEVSGKVEVFGTVNVPGFAYYNIEFGLAEDPIGWGILQGDTAQVVENSKLGELDLAPFEAGPLTIRVWVYDNQGHHAEKRVTVFMKKPTPTPQPTGQPTATQLPTPTTAPTTEPPTATVPAPTEEPGVTTTP
jgi:membrane peptidoglycan carboxypeptidase